MYDGSGFGGFTPGDGPDGYKPSPRRSANTGDEITELNIEDHREVFGFENKFSDIMKKNKFVRLRGQGQIYQAETSQIGILYWDPWDAGCRKLPSLYSGGSGSTSYWASAWVFGVRDPELAFWKELEAPKKHGRTELQMSGVTWRFDDTGKRQTSIVFLIRSRSMWSTQIQSYVSDETMVARYRKAIAEMKETISKFFQ